MDDDDDGETPDMTPEEQRVVRCSRWLRRVRLRPARADG